ncbi:MAG TPA: Calx-beta domain-containing protein, partial [Phycisphaerae bacterium]|nr:Calx-beta domain-containing protein [Phycisphaerae bacterium]
LNELAQWVDGTPQYEPTKTLSVDVRASDATLDVGAYEYGVPGQVSVAFDLTASNGDESVTPASLSVSLSETSAQTVTVDYAVTGGTATGGGTDYTLAAGTLTFDPNDVSETIAISIVDDGDVESDETIEVTLSNPSNASLGANTVHTYTINDNDVVVPQVQFDLTSSSGDEGVATVNLSVSLDQSTAQTVAVDYSVTGGTAVDPDDFTIAGTQLTFNPGVTQQDIVITVVDDALVESDETIEVTLSNPTNATLGANTVHTYTILDNDVPGGDTVWVEDAVPTGGIPQADGGDSWNWVSSNPTPYSGSLAHQSNIATGEHQHYFTDATETLAVDTGDTLIAYVYLDPANVPSEIMLQWNDGSWEHRAYWGANNIAWGTDGTASRMYQGPLPAAGQWVRLEVAASQVGLEGSTLTGMAFTLYDGRATWDHAGKSTVGNGTGLTGEYYDNIDFTALTLTRVDATVNFNWGSGSPDPSMGADTFSIRWTGQVQPLYSETYTFYTNTDDGVRLWVDGQLIVDHWVDQGPTEWSGTIALSAGVKYDIEMEYYENGGGAVAELRWSSASQAKEIIPQGQLYPGELPTPTVAFDLTASNGAESVTPVSLAVSLSSSSQDTVTVDYAVTGGDATGGGVDYTLAAGTLTFDPNDVSKTIDIAIVDDGLVEADETIEVTLSNPTGATLGANTVHTYTILDNDVVVPEVQFDLISSSGDEGVATVNLSVSLDQSTAATVTVDYAVTGGTAVDPDDYSIAGTQLTFNPGVTQQDIVITVVNDGLVESDETIEVTLSNPSNATLGANTVHTYTINDNDVYPTVEFDLVSSSGDESVATVNLSVSLGGAYGQTVTVDYAVTGGTATGGGVDYTLAAGTLTFDPNDVNETINITIVDDGLVEADETIEVTLSNPSNATLGTNTVHTYTINNNDAYPAVQFDLTASSGDESVTPASLAVSLSAAYVETVTVDYAVTGGTATGGGVDYTLAAGTLTFDPNDVGKTIAISVVDDALVEADETIEVTLSNPSKATLGANTVHTYTINNNDAYPTVQFDLTASAGDESVTPASLAVSLSAAYVETVTVDYAV